MLVGLNKKDERVVAVKGYDGEVYCPDCGEFNGVNYLRAGFFNKKWW